MTSNQPLLELDGLCKYFDQGNSAVDVLLRRNREKVQAVDDVSLALHRNESLGVIGESGCGKTTLLMTLMGLYEPTAGTIQYKGRDAAEFDRGEWKEFRSDVQIIFQDPFNSLDPKLTVRESLLEPLKVHDIPDRGRRVEEALQRAELRPPEKYLDRRPGQLSGGELQRVSIARALILEPEVILADEPVSMLDVSTQASILNLLSDLISDLGVSMFYISHDLSTVSYVTDRINVMYLGRIVESAPTVELLEEPKHPYTRALVNAIPIPDPVHKRERVSLGGTPGNPIGIGEGCRFRDRCPDVIPPADYELEQEEWRAVMDVRGRIEENGPDQDALVKLADVDPAETDDETFKGAVRRALDVPEPLSDPAAEALFDEALAHVVADDRGAARELLATEFATVCERTPVLVETDDGHRAACHLHYDHEQVVGEGAPGDSGADTEGRASADGGIESGKRQ